MKLTVTGHRPARLGGYSSENRLRLEAFAETMLLRVKPNYIITGMAQGWDQAIATAAVSLKIPFTAALPFENQPSRWPPEAQRRWRSLVDKAFKINCPQADYRHGLMQERNEWMVDHADQLLALFDGSMKGGTADCVRYAKHRQVPITYCWNEYQAFTLQKILV